MTRTFIWRFGVKTVLALAIVAGTVVAAPVSAVADDGTRTYTKHCDGSFMHLIDDHAGLRNCTLVWGKNIFDGSYWQTITFDLLDAQTDGHCARAHAVQEGYSGGPNVDWYTKECSGVWKTRSHTFGGRADYITLYYGWGSTNRYTGWVGYESAGWPAPSGF